jgi:murein DD-endopeptidase MepM/ murein hydrolase activator NlpD
MDRYSLIVVSDETAPVRRFEIPKLWVRRGVIAAGVAGLLGFGIAIDYVRVKLDNRELAGLREETEARRAQVAEFQKKLEGVDLKLSQLHEFERKIRIIANLPGSAASGGADVTAMDGEAIVPDEGGDAAEAAGGEGGPEDPFPADLEALPPHARVPRISEGDDMGRRVSLLREAAETLGVVAEGQTASLADLVAGLEGKRELLASSPSIWPAKGWMTSRYGYRVSPFTNKPQFHAGLDIAGTPGTPVIAPAYGRVTFVGKRGPMGNAITIDHGHGVRTQYGHNDQLRVRVGQIVERGDVIATLGNTGRSTGPHLHYVVEVHGKTKDPLDFIFE